MRWVTEQLRLRYAVERNGLSVTLVKSASWIFNPRRVTRSTAPLRLGAHWESVMIKLRLVAAAAIAAVATLMSSGAAQAYPDIPNVTLTIPDSVLYGGDTF